MTPFKFKPYYKNVIWGGTEIARFKEINIDRDDIGESWEISGVPGHESIVSDGAFTGKTITQLIELFGPELVGTRIFSQYGTYFPLLLKIIDAHSNLSIQVHPNDDEARKRGYRSGKTEMWYLLESEPGAIIYSGFRDEMSPGKLRHAISADIIMDSIHAIEGHSGDTYFIPAGRVHAIGAGNLLIEIQQTSDTTFRLYDYNRIDKNGKPRELHIEDAINALDYSAVPVEDIVKRGNKAKGDSLLAKCSHFMAEKFTITGSRTMVNDRDSFIIATATKGHVTIITADRESASIKQGESILIPACDKEISFKGNGEILLFSA